MNSSSGLGLPGPGQPEFDRPADASWSPQVPPQFSGPGGAGSAPSGSSPTPSGLPAGDPVRSGPWAPPTLPPPSPSGPSGPAGPGPRRNGVRGVLIGGTLVVMVALGLLAWQLLPATPAATPTPSVAPVTPVAVPSDVPPSVARTPETPAPTTSSAVTGGSIGQHIGYRTTDGEAQVTVTKASWVDNGALAPTRGLLYLVLDVRFDSLKGAAVTGPFFTAVREPGGTRHLITVGAALADPLAMRTLSAGESNAGQIAFEVARGPVTFEVLDESLEPVASVEIPG